MVTLTTIYRPDYLIEIDQKWSHWKVLPNQRLSVPLSVFMLSIVAVNGRGAIHTRYLENYP